jgi:hypothetical protein
MESRRLTEDEIQILRRARTAELRQVLAAEGEEIAPALLDPADGLLRRELVYSPEAEEQMAAYLAEHASGAPPDEIDRRIDRHQQASWQHARAAQEAALQAERPTEPNDES